MKQGFCALESWIRRAVAWLLTGFLTAVCAQTPHAGLMHAPHERVMRSLDEGQPQELIVVFDDAATQKTTDQLIQASGHASNHPQIRAHRVSMYRQVKSKVKDQLPKENWMPVRDHSHLPVSVVRFQSREALTQWMATPGVAGIYENRYETKALAESLPLISQVQAATAGQLGAGTAVAVLDTGVNYTRPEFGNCSSPGVPSGCKVVFAQDFAADDGRQDADGHGTNVAAIVLGVAPATKIISLDVFGSTGTSSVADQISAINWVIANQAKYNIVAMNLSLGGGKYFANTTADPRKVVFDAARAAGILTVAAAGNDGYSNALAVPAAITGVISVGAVYDAPLGSRSWGSPIRCTDAATKADQVACFSNSASFLTMLAPGALITAGGRIMGGTSQAAPHVAGAVAVLRAAYPTDSLDQTVARLTTGDLVTDARNDVTKPRLDLRQALGSLVSCTYKLSNNQISLSGQAGSGGVDITTQTGCGWIAGVSASNSSWITVASGSSGSGNGTVTFQVSANNNAQARTGTVTIAGLTYTVIQQGASVNSYNLLANSDFESGEANWLQSAANDAQLVTSYLNPEGTNTRYVWLCGYDNCLDTLYQDVFIPADASAATLQFRYQISTEETNPDVAYDKLKVSIFSPPTQSVPTVMTSLSNADSQRIWTTSQPIDLLAFKGKTVRLHFSGMTDASLTTSFNLDDIRLTVVGAQPDAQAPTVPTGLTARVNGSNSVTLSWSAASDNVGVSHYKIFRNKILLDSVTAGALSYTDTSVTAATTYSYSITACDVVGNCSAASVAMDVTSASVLADRDPPSVPLSVKATAQSQSSIRLTWASATDNVGVVAYQVYRNGSLLTTINNGSTSYLDSSLTPSTPYSYSVAACDAAGNCSAQSLVDLVSTFSPPNLSPIVFSGVSSFQVNGSSVNIKINEIKNTGLYGHSGSLRLELWALTAPYYGGQVTGYVTASVRTSKINGLSDYLNASSSFTNITLNLPFATPPSTHKNYALFVTEYDTTNCSQADRFCIVNYINYYESEPPSVPTFQRATALNSAQVQLTWAPSTDSSGVSNYQIYRDGVLVALVGNVTTYTDGGLKPLTTYQYAVAACDISQNCSVQSAPLSATTLTFQDISAPSVPTGLAGTVLSSTSVKLTWTAASDNIGVTNYKLFANGVFVADLGNTVSSVRSNAPSTTYKYAISACDASGNCSAKSPELSITTPALMDAQPPSIPTALGARSETPTSVYLNWSAATDNVGVTQYKLFRGNSLLTTLGQVTSFNDTGLKPSTTYVYKVQACDSAGNCSADSGTVSISTQSMVSVTTTTTSTSTTSTSTTTSTTATTTSTTLQRTSLVKGWNLIGNGAANTLEVSKVFGDTSQVTSVWKWLADKVSWAFYTPLMSSTQLQTYAQEKGYEVLTFIYPGEGFWVNAANDWTFSPNATGAKAVSSSDFADSGNKALLKGWSLIATGDNLTPAAFNLTLSASPPAAGVIPNNILSLWAWHASQTRWVFFAPSLQANGTLETYLQSKQYLSFGTNTLTPSTGFWVNKP